MVFPIRSDSEATVFCLERFPSISRNHVVMQNGDIVETVEGIDCIESCSLGDRWDKAKEALINGVLLVGLCVCGIGVLIYYGVSFLLSSMWKMVKGCLLGTPVIAEEFSEIVNDLRNLADSVEENFLR